MNQNLIQLSKLIYFPIKFMNFHIGSPVMAIPKVLFLGIMFVSHSIPAISYIYNVHLLATKNSSTQSHHR